MPKNAYKSTAVEGLSPETLVERAVRNAMPNAARLTPRWVAVGLTFNVGATTSRALCREYGLDPYEVSHRAGPARRARKD